MPTELLFDFSKVDLTRILLRREELRSYIDQRDQVEQLDRVIWVSEDRTQAIGARLVHANEWWVSGHIPGNPILPGVLMVETAAQFSTFLYRYKMEYLGRRVPAFLGFGGIHDTRFRATVRPGDELIFLIREKRFAARRIVADVQAVINLENGYPGRIAFETRILGMLLDGVQGSPGDPNPATNP